MDDIIWDDEPQLETQEINVQPSQEQGIIWDDKEQVEQPSMEQEAPQEKGLYDTATDFIKENLPVSATFEAIKTAKSLWEGKDEVETAIDVKSKLDNIESRTSDIAKTLKSFAGDEKSIQEMKTKQNDLNNEVVSILDSKGIESFNDNGVLMVVTKGDNGEELLKPLTESTFDTILSDLGSSMGEIGGGVAGAMSGASLANKALPVSAPIPLRGVATATGGLLGGYLGSTTGRITDIIRNSLALNREIDAKSTIEKGLESGALDTYGGVAGVGLGKMAGKIGNAVTDVKRYIVDGNINGAKKILKSDYDLTDKQIDTMFDGLTEELSGLDDLQGAKLVRAKLTSAVQQSPQGLASMTKAIESNPKAAIQLSKEIDQRARFVEKAANSISKNPNAIKKSLFAYQRLVKKNYGQVRNLMKKALPDYKYNLEGREFGKAVEFRKTITDIGSRVIDPTVKDKLTNLVEILEQKTNGSIDDLVDLRQMFNKFYGKNKGHFELATDKKSLMSIQETIDKEIDKAFSSLPEDTAKGLKNAFTDAKSKYKDMFEVEDNVAFKQIMKKGASDADIAKSLVKFSKSSDQTMEKVLTKLNPKNRMKAEFSILSEMIKKSSKKGEAKALDFNKLLEEMGTAKNTFKSPEAKQFIKNIEGYDRKFGKDMELQRVASGVSTSLEKSIATTLKGKIEQKLSAIRFEAIQRLLPTENAKRIALQEAISKSLETSRAPTEMLFKLSKNKSIPSKERALLIKSVNKIIGIEDEIKNMANKEK